jgi:8-oxo-dGTP pyrophosphatase MutT (NUDIX family)
MATIEDFEKMDFYQVSLKVLIKNEKGEILALKNPQIGSMGGFYDIPGGRIHKDEFSKPFTECITREIEEEIGGIKYTIDPRPVSFGRHVVSASISPAKKDTHVLYIFFKAEYAGGEVEISNEHVSHEWLKLEDLDLEKYFKSGILEGIKNYLML